MGRVTYMLCILAAMGCTTPHPERDAGARAPSLATQWWIARVGQEVDGFLVVRVDERFVTKTKGGITRTFEDSIVVLRRGAKTIPLVIQPGEQGVPRAMHARRAAEQHGGQISSEGARSAPPNESSP